MGGVITDLKARTIIDSRGNPTVEVDCFVDEILMGRAAVPSGASTGSHEAVELRDGTKDWMGKGVTEAVNNVNNEIKDLLIGLDYRISSTVVKNKGKYFRLKAGPFIDKKAAKETCRILIEKKAYCVVTNFSGVK